MSTIRHIAVVIPARNEEQLLPACLTSIRRAQRALPEMVTSDIILAVDSSTDRTLEIGRELVGVCGIAFATDAGTVGMARSEAVKLALSRYGGEPATCWLANTDADCEVPGSWLADQIALARMGAQAVAGTIDVHDFSEHAWFVGRRFRETYLLHADGTHPHVHGANFGVRADLYLRAGGWRSMATAEDHDLWNRLSLSGCRRQSVARLKVITSGRRMGRAPRGFAEALAAHNEGAA
jgi:Glycosyl transferase family 2